MGLFSKNTEKKRAKALAERAERKRRRSATAEEARLAKEPNAKALMEGRIPVVMHILVERATKSYAAGGPATASYCLSMKESRAAVDYGNSNFTNLVESTCPLGWKVSHSMFGTIDIEVADHN